jgi:hypothetical protein
MSIFDPYVEKFLPGRVVDNTGGDGDEGPVTSVVGEAHYVSYVVVRQPDGRPDENSKDSLEGRPKGGPVVEVLHQEEHDTPYEAGKAFGRMLALAPERKKERPPGEADPIERLAWEQDVERARMDMARMQVAMEDNPEMGAEEIIREGLDRPPEERH